MNVTLEGNSFVKLAALLLLPVVAGAATAQEIFESQEHRFKVVPVAEGLQQPWSIAFLPGGDILVTERAGRLRVIRNGALLPNSVEGLPTVRAGGQGGLLDVVAHPNFASNRFIYLSFSKPNDAGERTTAVVRARLENDRLTDVREIFEAKAWSNAGGHFGSKLAFDSRGYLFITVGDRQASPRGNLEAHPAQNLMNHQGTVIRLHDDGRVPTDNPFVGRGDALPEIYSYGHRNLQGLAINLETGDVWQTEHGPQGGDELNLVLPGRNYGWPVIGFGVNYGPARTPIHESTARAGMEQPVHYWVPSIATSGLMLYTGDRFPKWKGNLFVGGLAGQQIARLTLDGHKVASEETLFQRRGTIRDVRQGPDGFIYVAIGANNGVTLIRFEPAD